MSPVYIFPLITMELKLDGNSEIGVHVMSDILFGNESGRKFEI